MIKSQNIFKKCEFSLQENVKRPTYYIYIPFNFIPLFVIHQISIHCKKKKKKYSLLIVKINILHWNSIFFHCQSINIKIPLTILKKKKNTKFKAQVEQIKKKSKYKIKQNKNNKRTEEMSLLLLNSSSKHISICTHIYPHT